MISNEVTIKDFYGQVYKVDIKSVQGIRKFDSFYDEHNIHHDPLIEITMADNNRVYIRFFNEKQRDFYFNKLIKQFHN